MSNLSLEKRILYSTTFCTYREPKPNKIACKHMYSFGICDLDLCPLVQEYYANVVFLPEGITLVIKEPSEERVAGNWRKVELKITLDNESEIIELVKKEAAKINKKNMDALIERIHRIYERFRFLHERGKEIPIIEEQMEEVEEEVPEELEEEFEEELEEEEEGEGELNEQGDV